MNEDPKNNISDDGGLIFSWMKFEAFGNFWFAVLAKVVINLHFGPEGAETASAVLEEIALRTRSTQPQ